RGSQFVVKSAGVALVTVTVALAGCSGGPLSTREKGAGIGALGGAAAGGIIGSAVGHPGVGAAIGGAFGLGAGGLVGDQLQGQENTNYQQQQQINRNQADLDRQRQDIQRLQRQRSEY
ncbi:MAG TPA: glycine zipper domain-containing protein, partial [Candidatus Limnocylindrales bacterium]|nr:glycine zipper domain-containing protein [Candidatus Limnocylindrales bacterium]